MQHTLVAVFDNRSDAQNAMDELLASGFTRTDVNVSSADPTGQTDSLTGTTPHTSEVHEGFMAQIKHFFTGLFGGGQNTRALHPWFGVILLISFGLLFVRFWKHNLWNRDDTNWMRQIDDVVKNDEEKLPELGKYNAGQKIVFWATALFIVILFATGLVMWDQYFAGAVTIETGRVAALVHAVMAWAAILLIIVHVYAGIWVRGSVTGMTKGRVTGGWAWRHHRKWLRAEVKGDHTSLE